MAGNGLCVRGRGAEHQVDVLGEFAFTPAFSLPIRLFLEAKFRSKPCDLRDVRNALGVIDDINENFVHGAGSRLRKRFRYVYALFSASGFAREAQDFALAQQISLVDLAGPSFMWLREIIEDTAARLYEAQEIHHVSRFPVNWMRNRLRRSLHTMPDNVDNEVLGFPVTGALEFALIATPLLDGLAEALLEHQQNELLLGFPAAPFILPLVTSNIQEFLDYARVDPEHAVRLRRMGVGHAAEWVVSPTDQGKDDLFDDYLPGYRLTFNLPDRLESWIGDNEEYRINRTRAVKREYLSDIVIYRMEGDNLHTYQLKYEPTELRRS
jgi:hypothetical protein